MALAADKKASDIVLLDVRGQTTMTDYFVICSGASDRQLNAIADDLDADRDALMTANRKDLEAGRQKGLDAALLDRLELNASRIDAMIEGLRQIAGLPDPVGEIFDMNYRPSGIQVGRMRVPLGVVGIITAVRQYSIIERDGVPKPAIRLLA